MLQLLLILSASFLPPTPVQSPAVTKGVAQEIQLASDSLDGLWGLATRTVDHATVATNSVGDVLVVFHSDRTGYQGTSHSLKQVEAALYRYNSSADEWAFTDRFLLGSVTHTPLQNYSQQYVRCERPDVIAVGMNFFVVWTRRYDRDHSIPEEPAVLECAWLTPSGSTFQVHNGGLLAGRGFPLDSDYHVRECAGVPDAVLLDAGSASRPVTVGVAYAHQTDFGDDHGGFDNTRLCDLRLVTCAIDAANVLSVGSAPIALASNITFNGDTAPAGGESAGLILPDCAPAIGTFRFWLIYEEQLIQVPPSPPDGRIHLEFWERNGTGAWERKASHNFGSSSSLYARRRPNVSSYPAGAGGLDTATIAFNKSNSVQDGDVVFEEWMYSPDNGLYKNFWPPNTGYDNPAGVDDIRPVPLHGRTDPLVRRCYVDRNGSPCVIVRYDVDTDLTTILASSTYGLGRPAVSYWFNVFQVRDDVALSYEKINPSPSLPVNTYRIWLQVD